MTKTTMKAMNVESSVEMEEGKDKSAAELELQCTLFVGKKKRREGRIRVTTLLLLMFGAMMVMISGVFLILPVVDDDYKNVDYYNDNDDSTPSESTDFQTTGTTSSTSTSTTATSTSSTTSTSSGGYHITKNSNRSFNHRKKSKTIQIPTKMNKTKRIPASIVLPNTYDQQQQQQQQKYSVVYLLHGAGGSFANGWTHWAGINEMADKYNVILVAPDGGSTSWYFDSPIDPEYQYETFICDELVPYIDKKYSTKASPDHRAIMGNSMGGHGAFFLSIRHPDIFGTAVSLSGGVDLWPFPDRWDIAKRIGSRDEFPERWREWSVIHQANVTLTKPTTKKQQQQQQPAKSSTDTATTDATAASASASELNLSMDIGTGDFFLHVNRNLHELLLQKKIKHEYTERPGGHSVGYWINAAKYQFIFIDQHINNIL